MYDDLCRLARAHLRRERARGVLSATELAHEAYVQMAEHPGPEWRGRARFFALVSRTMRHVLIDHARRQRAAKRGGGETPLPLPAEVAAPATSVEPPALVTNQALAQLASRDRGLARVVEWRVFGGMSEEEIAQTLGVSTRTIERRSQLSGRQTAPGAMGACARSGPSSRHPVDRRAAPLNTRLPGATTRPTPSEAVSQVPVSPASFLRRRAPGGAGSPRRRYPPRLTSSTRRFC
jgi:RNA polymerase sigma factor (TIGR02999 family)